MAEPYTAVRLSPLRKVIAARMTEAKQSIPHYRLAVDIEMNALLARRVEFNASHPDVKVSVNDCLIKACAAALMRHPYINSQLVGEEIRQHHHADIAVVVAVEGGLSTPIVRQAEKKSLREIAIEVKALAARAAAGTLKMNEILGGSFSISNLGSYGVDQFDAIINPPQCAILAVGRARAHMLPLSDGEWRVATLLRATLSVDHRAIDGITGAEFLKTLRQIVEEPQEPW